MKTTEELNALKEEVKALNQKLAALNDDELAQVAGGDGGTDVFGQLLDEAGSGRAVKGETDGVHARDYIKLMCTECT